MINSMQNRALNAYRQISVSPSVAGLESYYPSQAVTAIAFDVAPTANPASRKLRCSFGRRHKSCNRNSRL